ncbi:AT-hook motif nuclear-localized protein 29-like [Cicer arietinum]|uniref:AT-hook motif nuclear-localized protein 29-like n=1 Tax=Cicer arietinum TaxID=3827 RepID=A0A1S2XKA2_CICAR|nr:AT-hook motif nuclear-localized protein 29-like [Cicer arietinum]
MSETAKKMVIDHNNNATERSQELNLFMLPRLELQTPNINVNPNNNHHQPSSVVTRRPRGRPLGSKNKPKAPLIVKYESPTTLHSHVLEIATGSDVAKSLFDYAQRQSQGISILSGNGVVAQVILRQSTGRILPLMGRFQIISISGTILPLSMSQGAGGLSVYLSRTTGQVLGGTVVAPLVALSPVVLIVACFAAAETVNLPLVAQEPSCSTIGMRNIISNDINYPSSLLASRYKDQ